MKCSQPTRRGSGFTLVEMLTVVAIITILAAMLMPAFSQAKARARRVACVSQLRQIGYGFHLFANDHQNRLPMQVPAVEGGSREFVQAAAKVEGNFYFAFRHFQVLSNELETPQILLCPADSRLPTNHFSRLQNENVSYFLNVQAESGKATSMLAGDRNLTNDALPASSSVLLDANTYLRWTREQHRYRGNILYGDGHVEEWNHAMVMLRGQGAVAAALEFPSTPGGASAPASGTPASTRRSAGARDSGTASNQPPGSAPPAPPPGSTSAPPVQPVQIILEPVGVERTRGQAERAASRLITKTNTPQPTNAVGSRVPAANPVPVTEPVMGLFDMQLVQFLQDFVKWTYLGLLLLVLLYLAFRYWLWRKGRPAKVRKSVGE